MRMNGAEIFVEMLKREGVKVIFGFPGGAVLNIYDELYKADIDHVLVRHEQGAVHAADGYARASGKVGVVLVTSGPGATNTVTGITTAYMDSVPVVVFTGQVPTSLIGNDAFQEADIVGITRPCTKHNYLVKDIRDLPGIIKEAFYIARTGRPGPVLVDLPKDVIGAETDFVYPEKVDIRGYKPIVKGHPLQIKKAVEEIFASTRPVIYAGGGIIHSEASQELKEFAEMLSVPVTLTLMGLGGFPADNPLFLGMVGMHGTFQANMAIDNSNLIIAVGARFDDRVTGRVEEFAKGAKIIHVDIDPSSISKNIQVDIPIVGDAKQILRDMITYIRKRYTGKITSFRKKMRPWLKQVKEWAEKHPLTYTHSNKKIKPQYVVERIYELTKGRAIITTEVGQNQMWAAQFYRYTKPRTFLTSGGLGTMGYGFPAAIGAQVAKPQAVVIDIAGDGSILMNIQELTTAVQYRLPVKIAILNNRFLGMVRQWQELFYGRRYAMTCLNCQPDFVKLAESFGAVGFRAEKPEEVDGVIKEALRVKDKPVIMDFVVDREESVFPMVPAGAPLRDMILL